MAGTLGAMEPDMVADSVTDALAQLAAAGYGTDFVGRHGMVHCSKCNEDHGPELAQVDHVYRYEGPSDPDEEAIVLALSCPACGAKGTLVSGYGPSTDPDDIELIVALSDDRR
jgi:hypothetical protein